MSVVQLSDESTSTCSESQCRHSGRLCKPGCLAGDTSISLPSLMCLYNTCTEAPEILRLYMFMLLQEAICLLPLKSFLSEVLGSLSSVKSHSTSQTHTFPKPFWDGLSSKLGFGQTATQLLTIWALLSLVADLDLRRKARSGGPSAPLTPFCRHHFYGVYPLESTFTNRHHQLPKQQDLAHSVWLLTIVLFLSLCSQA